MATYYVIKDPISPGTLRYLANTWPNPNGTDGIGSVTLTTILNLASNNTIVIDGGMSGLSYSGTELGSSGTLSSYRANLIIRMTSINDPDYADHIGLVSLISSSGAILLSTVVMSNFNFTSLIFESTSSGGASCLFDLNITSGVFNDCSIINNYGSHTSGVVLLRDSSSNVTFNNVNFSGSGNNIYILQNNGRLTVNGGYMDSTNLTSKAAINSSGTGIIGVINGLTVTGNDGTSNGNMAISIGTCSSFVVSDCDISHYGSTPIITTGSSGNISIFRNTIYNCRGYGLINNSPAAQIYDNDIHDIAYSGNGYGIYNNANECSIYENIIYDIDAIGIYNLGNNNNIYCNRTYNCWNGMNRGSGGLGTGIFLGNGASANRVYRNYVYNNFTGITIATNSGTGANAVFSNLVYQNHINDIDQQQDSGVNHELIYNNTVLHSPSYTIGGDAYIGHGIAIHVLAKKSKVINNVVIVNQAIITCDGLAYSQTNTNLVEIISDYNQVYATCQDANIGTLDFLGYTSMSAWRSAIIFHGNGKIKGLDGTVDSVEIHSSDTNPLFVSSSDFHLTPSSPCVASGYDLGETYSIDYDGISPYSYGGYGRGAYVYPGVFFSKFNKLDNIVGLAFSKISGVSTPNLYKLNNFS